LTYTHQDYLDCLFIVTIGRKLNNLQVKISLLIIFKKGMKLIASFRKLN